MGKQDSSMELLSSIIGSLNDLTEQDLNENTTQISPLSRVIPIIKPKKTISLSQDCHLQKGYYDISKKFCSTYEWTMFCSFAVAVSATPDPLERYLTFYMAKQISFFVIN